MLTGHDFSSQRDCAKYAGRADHVERKQEGIGSATVISQ